MKTNKPTDVITANHITGCIHVFECPFEVVSHEPTDEITAGRGGPSGIGLLNCTSTIEANETADYATCPTNVGSGCRLDD
ncbi:hypothetical protein D8S78_20750 [Natrialba swarupiae]|nr:hypothetical protein [Natrialba swarupiae]